MATQRQIESILHPQHVKERVTTELVDHLGEYVDNAVVIYSDWLNEVKWASHEARKDTIRNHDKHQVVLKVLTAITMSCQSPLPLVSIAGMVTLSDDLQSLDSYQLTSDLIALLEPVGLYKLNKEISGTYVVQSCVTPSDELLRLFKLGCYLPPMTSKPKVLESNDDSGYLTINKDSLILGGKLNYHSNNISLDVINKQNSNEYVLDTYITDMQKPITYEQLSIKDISLLSPQQGQEYENQVRTYDNYLEQFNYLKELIKGKTLYFTHKVDKRGRLYCQAYHFNYMGNDYDKACVNLAHKELITGEL